MLANLLLGGTSSDEWTPSFRPGHYTYNVSVPHSTERTFVEPIPANPGAVFAITVNPTTTPTSIGPTSAQVGLSVGITTVTVTVTVTAQDGASRTYTVNITRADLYRTRTSVMLTTKLRYWLVKRSCRRCARDYQRDVDRMGLEWTLALIDEDVELHGNAFNHALVRAGVIDYAQRTHEG